MLRAWTFLRRSTDRQELSIEDQRKACLALATRLGAEVVREFAPPKGYGSGLTIESDPAFQEMVRLAEAGADVQHLLIYDVSRLGRLAPKRKFYWEEHFRRHGIEIIYAAEPFQNDGSLGDEIHQFVSHSEAHQFSLRLSRSTVRGAKSHAQLGHSCGGRPPYGYGRVLVSAGVHLRGLGEGERKAEKTQHVRWCRGESHAIGNVVGVFQAYAQGQGLGQIAEDLNARGIKAPRGGAWAKNQILSMLKNPAYIGTRVYFKHNYHDRSKVKGKRVRPESEWTVKENAHPALIEKDLWDRVQARFRARRPRQGRIFDSPYLLSGSIRCARCGHRYYGQKKKGELYYICGGYHTKGKGFCSAYSVKARELESFVLDYIAQASSGLDLSDRVKVLVDQLVPVQDKAQESATAALEGKELEIGRVLDAIRQGGALPSLVEELSRLEAQKKSLKVEPLPPADGLVEDVLADLKDIPGLLAQGSVAERREVIKGFLQEIEVRPQEEEARFYFYKLPFLKEKAPGLAEGFHRDGCGGPNWSLLNVAVKALRAQA